MFLINKFILFYNFSLTRINKGLRFKIKIDFQTLLLRNSKTKPFVFIQVGANDGISHDSLFSFVKERKVFGLLIEPLKDYYEKLCDNYIDIQNVIKINKAVHPNLKEVLMYKVDPNKEAQLPEWAGGIASIYEDHHKKSNIPADVIVIEKVEADSLMNIVLRNNFPYHIDLIQIDVEGFDFEVIKMIDFSRISCKLIKFEWVNLSIDTKKESIKYLRNKGFYLFDENNDTIAVNLNLAKIYNIF